MKPKTIIPRPFSIARAAFQAARKVAEWGGSAEEQKRAADKVFDQYITQKANK